MSRRVSFPLLATVAIMITGCGGGGDSQREMDPAERLDYEQHVYELTELNEASFDQAISQKGKAVVLKFGATWCPPCKAIDKELPALSAAFGDRLDVIKVDVDDYPDLARQYNATSIPLLILFRDGEAVSNRVGFMDADELRQWIDNAK